MTHGRGRSGEDIWTSGHASPSDLREFALAMSPKTMVPIHGVSAMKIKRASRRSRGLKDHRSSEAAVSRHLTPFQSFPLVPRMLLNGMIRGECSW